MSKKILIIAPAWVGDMVMAQALFIDLKAQDPSCVIDVVAPASTHPLLARMPQVQHSFLLKVKHGELGWRVRKNMGQSLRAYAYDQAIILTNSFKSALIPWFARISQRTSWKGEARYILINDMRKFTEKTHPLMIERFLILGRQTLRQPLPWPSLQVSEADKITRLNQFQLQKDKKILALCPGAEYGPAKRWPPLYFAQVAQQKIKEGWQVWIFGGPKDQDIAAVIQQHAENQCVNLSGQTSLLEAVDLLACVDAVVTNDSGLMHIAAALNRPLVALYGSSSPQFTPPLSHHAIILSLNLSCSPCFKRECPLQHLNCLNQLLPARVLEALDKF